MENAWEQQMKAAAAGPQKFSLVDPFAQTANDAAALWGVLRNVYYQSKQLLRAGNRFTAATAPGATPSPEDALFANLILQALSPAELAELTGMFNELADLTTEWEILHREVLGLRMLVAKAASTLQAPLTLSDAPSPITVDVVDVSGQPHGGQAWAVGDVLQVQDATNTAWLSVQAFSDQTQFWRYTAVKILPPSGTNPTFTAATLVTNYGQTGV